MNMRLLSILGAFIALVLLTLSCGGTEESIIDVPIEIKNATDVGAVWFDLVYNPDVLTATEVRVDELSRGAEAGFNADTPGRMLIVIQNAPLINGDGILVRAYFEVLDYAGTSTFTLENIQAMNGVTLEYVDAQSSSGNFAAADMTVTAPVIDFSQ